MARPVEWSTTLRALGGAMLAAAEVGEWEQLADLEARRALLLEVLFSDPNLLPVGEDLAACLRETLAINEQLLHRSEAARDELAAEISMIGRGQRASRAYAQAP